jgi:hypothetical protein
MSRARTSTSLALCIACCALAWIIHDARGPDRTGAEAVDADAARPIASSVDALPAEPRAEPAAEATDRIDARLAAREASRPSPLLSSPAQSAAEEMPPAEAERRLARLLPDGVVDRRQLARFQADIAALPQAERFALSAALARAMNRDRIRIGE